MTWGATSCLGDETRTENVRGMPDCVRSGADFNCRRRGLLSELSSSSSGSVWFAADAGKDLAMIVCLFLVQRVFGNLLSPVPQILSPLQSRL